MNMINPESQAQLESLGYQIITYNSIDPHFRTNTFIRKPDGTLSAYYDELWQVPMSLNAGDEVSIPDIAIPVGARNTQSHEIHAQWLVSAEGQKLVGPVGIILILMFIGIVMGILFMKAFFGDKTNPPPCGVRGSVIEIDECVKEIIYPDCSGIMYDSCNHEIIDDFDPPPPPGPEWWEYAVYGIVGVGAIFVIYKLLNIYQARKPPPQPPT